MRWLGLLMMLTMVLPASAQVRDVRSLDQRPVGYTIGDRVPRVVDIRVDAGWRLRSASLPAPGPQNYWLELREVRVDRRDASDRGSRYRLQLDYQSFYAPIQALERQLPGFQVVFERGDDTATAQVPPWTFTMSPLREVRLSTGETGSDIRLRPDTPARPVRTRTATAALASALVLAALCWLALGWHYAWPPFRARPRRPFAAAVRALRRRPEAGDDEDYRERLRLLHRAFDQVEGRRLLADDVAGLLRRQPFLAPLADGVDGFFASSRLAFFGNDVAAARRRLPGAELSALAGRLAAAERGASP